MKKDMRKVVLIGTGMVGMSYAYALLNQHACDELMLIDINKQKAWGEAMDLNHGLAFSPSPMRIYAGEYSDCRDADLIVISAGVAQKPGESRTDLLQRNISVFDSILTPIIQSGFSGIFLVATNPVDIMTRVTYTLSGFPAEKVLGSGTSLDTARLRYRLGDYFHVDPRNLHAYVMGEHGDTEFIPWSQAMLATKPVLDILQEQNHFHRQDLDQLEKEVRTAAYEIIEAKQATYYGIGMALVRITKAIFGDENSILTISAKLSGAYGLDHTFAGVPCTVNREGVSHVLQLGLTREETEKLRASCQTLDEFYTQLHLT